MKSKLEVKNVYKLTPMQEGMLFHDNLDQAHGAYFVQMGFDVEGEVDIDILEKSVNKIIERHDVLRTNFVSENINTPVQVVFKKRQVKIQYQDISRMNPLKIPGLIEKYRQDDREKGFNLAKDPLLRLSVFKTGSMSYSMIMSFHHIIIDGWCTGIIFKELFTIYYAFLNEIPLELPVFEPFSTYLNWLQKQDTKKARDYWKKYLEGYENLASLPKFRMSTYDKEYSKKEKCFALDKTITSNLIKTAKENGVTLNTVFQALWGILYMRYNNTDDVVFGSVVSGRPPEIPDIEKMVGLFINTIPVRISSGVGQSFSGLLKLLQESSNESTSYDYISLSDIQSSSSLKYGLFDSIVVFENYPVEKEVQKIGGLSGRSLNIKNLNILEQTNYAMNVVVVATDTIEVKLNYNSLVYDDFMINKIGEQFINAALEVIDNPDLPVNEVSLISGEDFDNIVVTNNRTSSPYPKARTINELFEEKAENIPHNTAVEFKESMLTYRELDERSNCLARVLKSRGIKNDNIVALMSKRSIEMIVCIIGILKAGGAYLPIDPSYPKDRIHYMLSDSGTGVLLTHGDLADSVDFDGMVLNIDDEGIYTGDCSKLDIVNTSFSSAYVMYG